MREVTFAATQMACSWARDENVDRAVSLVREAAEKGAQAILLQELFETPYFCKERKPEHFELAAEAMEHELIQRMRDLAKELKVVLPLSFFERAHHAHFNSLVMIDADGEVLGLYRKSHIPDGPGYQEKYYFSPGDTGFKVWDTAYGRFGAAICWDQWFPEAARAMAVQGAEALFYPTAIGSEPPPAPPIDSRDHWQRVMQGHAAANIVPLVASNRIGKEVGEECELTFYGSSFLSGPTGEIVAEASRDKQEVITATFDLDEIRKRRVGWGLFRDRRPELYHPISAHHGKP
ncbi:N-carbamoylputrescine amidase [Parvibaculum indicum]|uniref:N-carbamoylputrescine amidase n=1 Tax=Parvibaculum indicum TaxID=562969 RepID=UPI001420BC70|nr:N-carbamoylputrescine amidase [Parvibaculum indicum]NIJ40056.1 N-carbamoylputrescine amidase [Parvibaculum indicum]